MTKRKPVPPALPSVLDRPVFIIESRDPAKVPGGWTEWEDLTPDLRYTLDDVLQFQAELSYDECFGMFATQWRARMLPEFGFDVRPLVCNMRSAPECRTLSRNMPASVHALNDRALTAMGV